MVSSSVRVFPKTARVPVPRDRPSYLLPDLVVLYAKQSTDTGSIFVETKDRNFAGYRNYYSTDSSLSLRLQSRGRQYESTKLAINFRGLPSGVRSRLSGFPD